MRKAKLKVPAFQGQTGTAVESSKDITSLIDISPINIIP